MSAVPISRSPDLQQLRNDGYEVRVNSAGLLEVGHVPFAAGGGQVGLGTLVSELNLRGDVTGPPAHTIIFVGGIPHDENGRPLDQIINNGIQVSTDAGPVVGVQFSSKPDAPYPNYHAKLTQYINMIQGPAQRIDRTLKAQTYTEVADDDATSVFYYLDTGPGVSGIAHLTAKLNIPKVAIVGLGGTGSYVLDLIAKCPIQEIHIFDADTYYSHNAFRSPNPPTLDQLRASPKKVDYFGAIYDRMRTGIVRHAYHITEANLAELADMDFVFVCVDGGRAKSAIIKGLEDMNLSFIDVGMGIDQVSGQLTGQLRVSTSVPGWRAHMWERGGVEEGSEDDDDAYNQNIQIAELNTLNAALAVIKWKKLVGLYVDLEREHTCVYSLNGNIILNGDQKS
jgi:hypothetical protein